MTEEPRVLHGRYELVSLLGRGGMAEVHRARDRVLSRDVAVKLLHDSVRDDVDRERFRTEARLMAGLAHPHLVTILDAGVDDEHPWLVMELVEGTTLGHLLLAGPITVEQATRIGIGVASALDHAQERGIVHRDVKPANILVTVSGEAKLADFGIARLAGDSAGLTRTGHTIGTAAYLAPEQISGEPVSGAADVYALGLVLLESLTGQRAYTGSATEAALARLHHGPLIPVSLPRGWPRLLDEMTAADASARPTASEVATRLAALGAATGAPPVVVDVLDATDTLPDARAGHRRAPWPLLIAAAVLVALLGVVSLVRSSDDAEATPLPHPSTSPRVAHTASTTTTTTGAPASRPTSSQRQTPAVATHVPTTVVRHRAAQHRRARHRHAPHHPKKPHHEPHHTPHHTKKRH